jgi:hypothetical protein
MNHKKLALLPRCNREAFILATEGIFLDRNAEGICRVGEIAMPFVEMAEQGKVVILTDNNNQPISFVKNGEERLIAE